MEITPQMITAFFSTLTIPPTLSLLFMAMRDIKKEEKNKRQTSIALILTLVAIVVFSIFSILIFLLGVYDLDGGHSVSVWRSIINSMTTCCAMWALRVGLS